MGLHDDIRQSKFRNEHQKAILNLMYTSVWVHKRVKKYLKKYNLTITQFNVLRILNGQKVGVSTAFIRERMLTDKADVTRIVERLFSLGLVERETNKQDRRLVNLSITKAGKELIAKADADAAAFDGIIEGMSEEECALLNDLLDKVRNNP